MMLPVFLGNVAATFSVSQREVVKEQSVSIPDCQNTVCVSFFKLQVGKNFNFQH